MFKFLYLIIPILLLIPCLGLPQTTQQNNTKQPVKEFDFIKQTDNSRKELGWSTMYLNSYHRTREIKYLNLAAKHCFNAIKSFHLTQLSLKKRTRYTYQTKKERLQACAFYNTIYKTSIHLKEQYHLLPINPIYCTHSVSN